MDDLTLEQKCENLMNVVVESRKIFGKKCAEYERKTAVMENQILNLQINTISKFKSHGKTKNPPPRVDVADMCKDINEFAAQILERTRRIERLRKKVQDTQEIVVQLKREGPGRTIQQPLTAEAMLAHAKQKQKLDR